LCARICCQIVGKCAAPNVVAVDVDRKSGDRVAVVVAGSQGATERGMRQ